jgi:molybdopterin molybdotransferase
MIPFEEALRRIDEACAGARVESEQVAARLALGRVLRADQRARLALPPFDKSAVDGFALPEEASGDSFHIAGVIHAGETPRGPLQPGTTVQVMTGAPVPPGAVRVVMVEHTEINGGRMRIVRADTARNICREGEDLRPGDVVLPGGAELRPLDLANLIAAGITEVEVARRVRLAILSTGDEIVDDATEIAPGRIMDSNGPMLAALVATHGLELARQSRVPDEPAATREAIAAALEAADLVVLTGGVSAGDSDYVPHALDALSAQTHFTRVAVKPGKPVTFAARHGRFVLGLPGNPVSAYLMFHLFALRIAALLSGSAPALRTLRLPLGAPFRRGKAARLEFVPARIAEGGGVEPIPYHGSAHLSALRTADGFFRVPVGITDLPVGAEVLFHPIGRRLGL